MKSNYKKMVEKYQDVDLHEAGTLYFVPSDKLTEDQKNKLVDLGFDEADDGSAGYAVDILSMHNAGIDPYLFSDDTEYNEEDAEDILLNFIKDSDHYLVFASGCRWNGASGYKLVSDRLGLITRGYDVTITPVAASERGKVLVCCESSHDVPTGSTTIMVALSTAEYNRLKDADFWTVTGFAEAQREKATA